MNLVSLCWWYAFRVNTILENAFFLVVFIEPKNLLWPSVVLTCISAKVIPYRSTREVWYLVILNPVIESIFFLYGEFVTLTETSYLLICQYNGSLKNMEELWVWRIYHLSSNSTNKIYDKATSRYLVYYVLKYLNTFWI